MTLNKVWHAAHGPAHVAAHASGREYAPRRAAVRAALSVLLLVLVLLSSPTDALAVSNPSVVWQSGTNYVVSPTSNGFDAALAAIGLYSVRPRLTTDMLAKLSNESTGGDFYDLAQQFQSVASAEPPWLSSNGSDFVNNATAYGITATQCRLYGRDNVMWSDSVTSADVANAKRDFNVIQNGGSLSGGSGGGTSGNYYIYDVYVRYVTSALYFYPTATTFNGVTSQGVSNNANYSLCPNVLQVKVNREYVDECISRLGDGYSASNTAVYTTGASTDGVSVVLIFFAQTPDVLDLRNETIGQLSFQYYYWDSSKAYSNKYLYLPNPGGLHFASDVLTFDNPTSYSFSSNFTNSNNFKYYMFGKLSSGSSGGGEVINRWPQDQITGHPVDEPVVPTPPTYEPITYTNPTDDPLPTPPGETPYTPQTPIVTTDPTNTTPQDYTPWLSAILNELRNFHRDAVGLGNNIMDALSTHCTHITTTIMDETEWLYNQLKAQIRAGVQAILYGLDQNCTEMMNYLEDLAEWLADQLQFTYNIDNSYNPEISVPAYDDGSVIAWLQRIYNAIRSIKGPTIGTPVTEKDIEDGFDWWAWLLSLLDQLFDNVISQTVGEVESFLEEFRNLFPLSIPWDMVAILTMYAGTPTTPEITLTFPAIASLGLPEYDLEIDLEPFDNAAYTIRQAEQIVFAFYLLFKTQWLLDTLKSATDAAGEFVEGLLT